jgi:zinc protease
VTAPVQTGVVKLPDLGPTRELKLPITVEQTMPNGLRVWAIRRPTVPLVELRLLIPFARADLATSAVLPHTLLSGTADKSTVDIAVALQSIGGGLGSDTDPDRLLLSGDALVSGLDGLLGVLAEVLTGATYPEDEVDTERSHLADRLKVALSQPSHLVRVALLKRIYAGHPYAVQTPQPDEVLAVESDALRELHRSRIRPAGATLVLVGDLDPETAMAAVQRDLAGWTGDGGNVDLPPTPPIEPGPVTLVDRPGSVQSSVRIALPAVPRTHPDYAILQLANLIFGGYFSSRWMENVRENKGYTYGVYSGMEQSVAGSVLTLSADFATEVTAPGLLETLYELGRLALTPPRPDELEQARQYALGTLQLGMATQGGLAGLATTYAEFGLHIEYLAGHAARLASATLDDVARAAATYLAPAKAAIVVLGDAEKVEGPLSAIGPLVRAPAR